MLVHHLEEGPRTVAWAMQYGLARSAADRCLRVVIGKHCLQHRASRQSHEIGFPHCYYNDQGCGVSSGDDHARLWYLGGAKPLVYVYSFHEYNIPAPTVPVTEVDDRGLKHTTHRISWYSPRTSMHVVTRPEIEETFPYHGELPRNPEEFLEMYQKVYGDRYPRLVTATLWDDFLARHEGHYGRV